MNVEEAADKLYESLVDEVDVSKEDIRERFETVMAYGVNIEEARGSILSGLVEDHEEFDSKSDLLVNGQGDGYPLVDISDITSSDQWVTVEAVVDQLWENDNDAIAQVGLLGDDSGRIKFTSWAKSGQPHLTEGQAYRIEGVVSNEWNGNMEVRLNANTDVEMLEDVDFEPQNETVEFSGAAVALQAGSGLFFRDEDGNIVGTDPTDPDREQDNDDLRAMIVLDNGSEVLTAYVEREEVETLSSMTLSRAQEIATETMDVDAPRREMLPELLGKYYTVTGGRSDDMIFADEIEVESDHSDPEELLLKARAL